MAPTVVAFGGSIIAPPEPDLDYLGKVGAAIGAWSKLDRCLVVVGGGHPARQAIMAARQLGVREEDLDRIGIQATRMNAQSVAALLHHLGHNVHLDVPVTTTAALATREAITVMGGTTPGHSTDQVAAELAVRAGAQRLIIATNVPGVYSADPRKDADAVRHPVLSFDELRTIVGGYEWTEAGAAGVIDGPATELICRHRLRTCVVDGHDLAAVAAAVRGDSFEGTEIMEVA